MKTLYVTRLRALTDTKVMDVNVAFYLIVDKGLVLVNRGLR
ncbi:hypothetical protein CRENPOLYSF1_220051 [Crenothrix polyspora]|uniref:Uncharacterized protein n=1 Tax=Crenothrix polyspora TaxID=360316 RepID=A0A1R4H6U8_9GAMM|nr:hypothetical protein CRENPOLYSF1_220051 [Crenothrix polyspora]